MSQKRNDLKDKSAIQREYTILNSVDSSISGTWIPLYEVAKETIFLAFLISKSGLTPRLYILVLICRSQTFTEKILSGVHHQMICILFSRMCIYRARKPVTEEYKKKKKLECISFEKRIYTIQVLVLFTMWLEASKLYIDSIVVSFY